MITQEHIRVLAQTLWGEARNQDLVGIAAVANVIMNRVADPRWPDDARRVCQQDWQFSCWNPNDPNREPMLAMREERLPEIAVWRDCWSVATLALHGLLKDLTFGSNHYFNPKVVRPRWAKGVKPAFVYRDHTFLRL